MNQSPVRVAIGLAVFNGERTLARALESLLSQTYPGFRLIISDNASTDATAQICAAFAARDPRITYVRQSQNIGAEANFDFVLAQADGEYFMWAAADDTKSTDFIESNLRFLDQHSDFVGSTCRVRFVGGEYDEVRMGDATRDETSASDRVRLFFDGWHANGRFYSLFRREALARAKGGISGFLGSDWVVVVRLLAIGKLNRLDAGSVDLGRGGVSQSRHFLASHRTRPLHWLFPIYEMAQHTLAAMKGQPLIQRVRVAVRLGTFNLLVLSHRFLLALHAVRRSDRSLKA